MRLSLRQLNRATLERQLLLKRQPLTVTDAVLRVVALQAQEPASPYLALWNRLAPFDPADLDRAFAGFELVKGTLLRMTLHAVRPDDYPTIHEAMQPTTRTRVFDRRFTSTGLASAELDELMPKLLAFAATTPRSNAEMDARAAELLAGRPSARAWWAIRTFGPFIHAPTGGPWAFGLRPSYLAAPDGPRPDDPELALQEVVRRYLAAFGPASIQDVAQFAMVYRTRARAAVEAIRGDLVTHTSPAGTELFDVPGAALPPGDSPAPPRLLPMWDSVLLAHADRARIISETDRPLLTRRNGDVLPSLLIDGVVAGIWRPQGDRIEVRAFRPLSAQDWDGVHEEAGSLVELLAGRDRRVYSRFGHWWDELPSAETRHLPE
jgi:DNA glycosylase AlkZ-like